VNARLATRLGAVVLFVALRPALAASAADMAKLAQSEGCFACHAIDQKKVGPAYTAVARRYAHNPNAAVILQDAILNGHQGTWGVIPMPAYAPDGDLDARQALDLARWILSLNPAR
jgi:cytochrome c